MVVPVTEATGAEVILPVWDSEVVLSEVSLAWIPEIDVEVGVGAVSSVSGSGAGVGVERSMKLGS